MNSDYDLVDVQSPQYYRDQFPYALPPRILFDHQDVPMRDHADLFITDTTFRDGQQARTPYTVEQIVRLYDLLHRLSGRQGLIRQSEFFLYQSADREAVEKCLERGYAFPQITAWIRAVEKDLALVRQADIPETGILTSCSDVHIYRKLGMNRREAFAQYERIVAAALEAGIRPRCHLEDVTRADIKGFVVPLVRRFMALSREAGIPVKIRLCDTMGYGVPFPTAVLPRSVPKLVHTMIHEAGVPGDWLEWHGHNDFYQVVSNATAAWMYGAGGVNGTLLGFGERTGNTPIEAMVITYMSLTGDRDVDTRIITDIAQYLERDCGYSIPPMTPFVGRKFNVTSAGIHADGVMKDEEIYNIFDTNALLNRPIGVAVTDKTGIAGVAFWVNHFLGRSGTERLDKREPGMDQLATWVREQYESGRTTSLSDEEMRAAAEQFLPNLFRTAD